MLVAALCLAGPSAWAADWTFEPSLRALEVYRSNANLGPSGDEESAWITEVSPGFHAALEGANNNLSFDYRMQGLMFRGDIDREDLYHDARIDGAFQLIQDRVFLDVNGRYDQQNINPTARAALDNTYDAGNRSDVGSIAFSPWWRQPIGNFADSLVRYNHAEVGYFNTDATTTNVQDSYANAVEWTLSDATQSRLGWQTYYTYQRVDYDESPEYEYQKAKGQLTYEIGSRTRLVAAGGSESDVSESTSKGSMNSGFYEGGFIWEPTSLQSLEARVGHRYFGTSWELHYKRRGSRGDLHLDYTEVSTTSAQILFDDTVYLPDGTRLGIPRQDTEVYLRKRFVGGITYEFARSVAKIDLYRDKRDYETSSEDDTYWGIRSNWTWDMMPRTQLLLKANWEYQDVNDEDQKNNLGYFSAEVKRTLRKNMTLGLQGAYYKRMADNSFNYEDTSGTLRFEATF